MRKSIFYLIALFLVASCTEQEELGISSQSELALSPSEFVNLSDGSVKAGEIIIQGDVAEASVKWVTSQEFNLDTTQTSVSLKNGKGVIPVKWREKQSNGNYAPENMYYKGWALVTVGEQTQSIPLYWTNGQPLDSTKVQKQVMTRAGEGEFATSSITFTPNAIKMSSSQGGKTIARTSNVEMAILDYSEFKDSYNLDLSNQIDVLENNKSTLVSFNWNNQGPAASEFSANLNAICVEIPTVITCNVSWTPEVIQTLNYASSNLPTGNIPDTGGMFMFQFSGTYSGGIQVRALADGSVISTGTETTDKQPQVGVTANLSNAVRNITFQYKRADGNWTALPTTTNRTQNAYGSGSGDAKVTYTNVQPEGYITSEGGTFTTYFSGFTGTILFRATLNGTELARQRGNIPGALALYIPPITASQGNVFFEYSVDGGSTWTFMESKTIRQESVSVNSIEPLGNIPSAGGTYTCGVSGNYSKTVSVQALYMGQVLATAQGRIPANFDLVIPANTASTSRIVTFQYRLGEGNWKILEYKTQLGR